jgi:hypothetical protein
MVGYQKNCRSGQSLPRRKPGESEARASAGIQRQGGLSDWIPALAFPISECGQAPADGPRIRHSGSDPGLGQALALE